MRVLGGVQGEHVLQVFLEEFTLGVCLDRLQESAIDLLLVLLALLVGHKALLLGSKDVSLTGLLLLLGLKAAEVGVVQMLGYLEVTQVHTRRGADDVALGNATQGARVEGEGSSDQQQARGQSLQQHNTFALVTTSQEDQHGTGLQVAASVALVLAEVGLAGTLLDESLGWVVGLGFAQVDGTLTTVLGATDLLHLLDGHLLLLHDGVLLVLQAVQRTALVHLEINSESNTLLL